jgi:hypothetical protein
MFDTTETSKLVFELFLTLALTIIPSTLIGFFLGKRQSDINWKRESKYKDKELQLLRDQLEEQTKSREFEERVHEESKTPKMHLTKWDFKS